MSKKKTFQRTYLSADDLAFLQDAVKRTQQAEQALMIEKEHYGRIVLLLKQKHSLGEKDEIRLEDGLITRKPE